MARFLGPIFGTGPGAGMALLILISGTLVAIIGFGAYRGAPIGHVDEVIPDHS